MFIPLHSAHSSQQGFSFKQCKSLTLLRTICIAASMYSMLTVVAMQLQPNCNNRQQVGLHCDCLPVSSAETLHCQLHHSWEVTSLSIMIMQNCAVLHLHPKQHLCKAEE